MNCKHRYTELRLRPDEDIKDECCLRCDLKVAINTDRKVWNVR